jgi:hypothetical protein
LKDYRFDILIVEMSGVSLEYRVVAYIEDFEIDTLKKISEEKTPKNVNLFNEINSKVTKIAQAYCKVIKILF